MAWQDSPGAAVTPHQAGYAWGGSYRPRTSPERVAESLAPLVRHLERYDRLRLKYETHGAGIRDLEVMSRHLNKRLSLPSSRGGKLNASLTDPESVRTALNDIGDFDVHLAVRQRETGMPVFYLCRTQASYWADYTFILEDLYVSPGYPILDDRFVQLMRYGHELFHLRLSILRPATEAAFNSSAIGADRLLRLVGEIVFQAAWHEDQRLALACARAFGVPHFRQAVELLYLCLCGDLCSVRRGADPEIIAFFERAYEQPAIARLLRMLPDLDGGEMTGLHERALNAYAELSGSFGKLLQVRVPWGRTGAELPIYKLVFANTTRVDAVGDALKDEPIARNAARDLDRTAEAIIDAMTE